MNLKKREFYKKQILKTLAERTGMPGITLKDENADRPVEMIDQAAAEFEENLKLLFKARGDVQMMDLKDALDRIENGTYGICLDCDGEIPEKRLMANPTARLCIDCQSAREKRRVA